MKVTEMMPSREVERVAQEVANDPGIVTTAIGTPSTCPITLDDVVAMYRKLTPKAYQ